AAGMSTEERVEAACRRPDHVHLAEPVHRIPGRQEYDPTFRDVVSRRTFSNKLVRQPPIFSMEIAGYRRRRRRTAFALASTLFLFGLTARAEEPDEATS